jgi:hypothetical protein
MLISMPHGTSTIFGAFQAILALLLKGIDYRPVTKVTREEKFASEIFCNEKGGRVLQCNSRLGHSIKSKLHQQLQGLFPR